MKKILYIISALSIVLLMSCANRAADEKQKKVDDSLFQPERNKVLDNANKLLSDSTPAPAKKDTVVKKK